MFKENVESCCARDPNQKWQWSMIFWNSIPDLHQLKVWRTLEMTVKSAEISPIWKKQSTFKKRSKHLPLVASASSCRRHGVSGDVARAQDRFDLAAGSQAEQQISRHLPQKKRGRLKKHMVYVPLFFCAVFSAFDFLLGPMFMGHLQLAKQRGAEMSTKVHMDLEPTWEHGKLSKEYGARS